MIAVLLILTAFRTVLSGVVCPAGTFYWVINGMEHCQMCQPGCACPGNYSQCLGCSGGSFSASPSATTCTPCPVGTTTDLLLNTGCDPGNVNTPCENSKGPLGYTACYTPPPAPITVPAVSGSLTVPPQYLTTTPPYIPNMVPPYYDIDDRPFLEQSY